MNEIVQQSAFAALVAQVSILAMKEAVYRVKGIPVRGLINRRVLYCEAGPLAALQPKPARQKPGMTLCRSRFLALFGQGKEVAPRRLPTHSISGGRNGGQKRQIPEKC